MTELFVELFSEEIPAGMQVLAAYTLRSLCEKHLSPIAFRPRLQFSGPRRIAVLGTVDGGVFPVVKELRGPKTTAPDHAIEGFLRKNAAVRNDLIEENGHYLLRRQEPMRSANDFIVKELSDVLLKFPWPKSMRWGQSGTLLWVRPLRRIVCLLDHRVVPLVVGPITASNLSEGHRFLAPGTFKVVNAAQWQAELLRRRVIADAPARRAMIEDGLQREAQALGLSIVKDDGLLDEVTGLVEYPVPLIGHIEQRFMALPPEVRELSMKVNQRYFSMRDAAGEPAPYFAFVANIEASDGGAAIIAGNERVLRARLADAEHFWAQDRQHPLEDYLPKLKSVVFHAKLGTQFERAERIAGLAREIAEKLGADSQEIDAAERAGRLCKADLVTGMVGEFPELQGIMGGYYAGGAVGAAIRTHYQPKGPSDEVPQGIVPCAVALADKLDTLREFFRIGETPTGSGDPYALRRAALGVMRIVLENRLSLWLSQFTHVPGLLDFIFDRLRVKLRGEGKRYDIINALLAKGTESNLLLLVDRMEVLAKFLQGDDGTNLMAGYRRASNILQIENAKDGPHQSLHNPSLLIEPAEYQLAAAIKRANVTVDGQMTQGDFTGALSGLAELRQPIDEFFDAVTVNTADPGLRLNRLALLFELNGHLHAVADFSKLEG